MRFVLLAGAALLVGSGTAQAAPAVMDTSFFSSPYVQLLGGFATGTTSTWTDQSGAVTDTIPVDLGYAFAATIGVVVANGFSVEADVQHTYQTYPGGGFDWETTSFMGNVKYTAQLNDTFGLYGAAGLGAVYLLGYFPGDSTPPAYLGAGFQLIAGLSAKLTDNVSGIVEYRYVNTFGPARDLGLDPNNHNMQVPEGTVMAGLKFSF